MSLSEQENSYRRYNGTYMIVFIEEQSLFSVYYEKGKVMLLG